MTRSLEFRCELPGSAAEAYAWHARPRAFERLAPPWDPPRLTAPAPPVSDGAIVRFNVGPRLAPLRWVAQLQEVEPGHRFVDTQVSGPFSRWRHEHLFEDAGTQGALMRDRLEVGLPLAPLSRVAWPLVSAQLRRVFAWRHHTTAADLALHAAAALPSQVIAVTGATGFLGTAVCELLESGGHRVIRMVRSSGAPAPGEARWIPGADTLPEPHALEGCTALVHLAGEGIAEGRWTTSRKRRILESRSVTTTALLRAFAALPVPPSTVVVASAVGFYGDRPADQPVDEDSSPGSGFLAEVVQAWEQAAGTADPWARRVSLRLGVVLDPRGGALAKMTPAFRLGAGGPIGSGRQPFPWISRDDAAAAVLWTLAQESLQGPVNAVAPDVRPQREFATALGRALRRPSLAPLPAAAVSLAFGEMGRETLLAGQHVVPTRLFESGFRFRDPDLDPTLARLFGRRRAEVH